MNSPRSLLNRALAQLSAATIASFALTLACSSDPAPAGGQGGASAGKGGASSAGAAGKPAKAGNAGLEDMGGSAGEADGSAGEAGEAGGAGHGGGATSGIGGMNPGTSGGSGGSGTAGGAQGGNGGAPAAVCGNNKLEAGEECDDGNTKDWDGCSSKCKSKCEACEKKYCAAPPASIDFLFRDCFTDMGGVSNPASGINLAQQGPAAGQPKQKLCTNLVECLRRTNCSQDGSGSISSGCFCGTASNADCKDPQKGPNGPCAAEVGAAAESTDLALVAQRENQTQYAVGMAYQIALMCDNDACPAECLQDKTPTACERCTFGDGPFGQNYGLGGPYYTCYFQPPLACASAAGPTATCPAATCAPAADCALATRCAENGVENCYGPDGHGPCAAEFAAATGSTNPATVLDRLKNGGDYASTMLVGLLETERQSSCKSTCFPSAAGGAGGGGAAGGQGGSGGANAGTGG